MPIRAILNGNTDVQVPMSEEEWAALKAACRTSPATLTLPCCGVRAIPRKSKYGTQHFAHFRHGECDWEPETQEHLAAKFEIIEGIKQAGWNAKPEYSGEGWRADVAAYKGSEFKAFEVQWSPQTLERSLERQRTYNTSGVPVYWFFRRTPNKPNADRGFFGEYVPPDFTTEGLPFFLLEQSERGFVVRFNREHSTLKLSRLAELATKGRFIWRPTVTVHRMQVFLRSMLSQCSNCGGTVRSVGINCVTYWASCGLELYGFRQHENAIVPKKHFRLVQKFLGTRVGRSLGCQLVLRQEQGCYRCPNCRAYAVSHRHQARHERDYGVNIKTKGRILSHPHWCTGGVHGLCSDETEAPSPDDWLSER